MKQQVIAWFSSLCLVTLGGAVSVVLAWPGTSSQDARGSVLNQSFFPLLPGATWLYRGTVTWYNQETQKKETNSVSITMKIESVIQKPEFTIAVISGFPADLDWSSGEVEPTPSLLIETKKHEIYLDPLPPDFDYAKLAKDASELSKLLSEDNLLFRWPLKKGMKFGDAETAKREDDRYCWVVATQRAQSLEGIQGLPSLRAEIFLLQYVTNPDDTELELSPGIGIISYQYHHHGSVADTSLKLVEFHPGQNAIPETGAH